ncbi:MAG: family 20 glycosylhydrolase [Gammaproteobacteria bacterium]
MRNWRSAVWVVVAAWGAVGGACGAEADAPVVQTRVASLESVSVIPAPASVTRMRGEFVVTSATRVSAVGGGEAERIARYFTELVTHTAGLSLRVVELPSGGLSGSSESRALNRRAAERSQTAPRATTSFGGAPGAIIFSLEPARITAAESYALEVSSTAIEVKASSPSGLFYGAVTLWQLITAEPPNAKSVTLKAVHIEDAPRFKWRGLMLDVSRHYMPPAFIEQLLDWMSLHKLNTFQWHLTDDQGWRLEIKKYPRLTEVGAWSVPAGQAPASDIDAATGKPRLYGGYYTQDEVRDIVRYAAERFITVVPEIEIPGHAQAAIAAYPQLGTEGEPPTVSSDWGVHTYLYNVDEATFSFLEDVLTEVMALFPGQYIHTGGDEAVKDRWRASPKVQQRMRELGIANEAALQGYFTHRIQTFVSAHGRKLIGWDEILEGGLPSEAAVMSWRGVQGGVDAVSQGHDVVMAPAPDLYLDYLQSDSADEPPGRPRYVTLADMYKFEVMPGAIAGASQSHVLGAQVNVWTEHMRTSARVEHAVFPRLAAFAKNVWSVPGRRDWEGFSRRLAAQFGRYRKLGIGYADSAFEVGIKSPQSPGGLERNALVGEAVPGKAAVSNTVRGNTVPVDLSNQAGVGDIRYTLNGKAPGVASALYKSPITVQMPATLVAATFVDGQRMSAPRTRKIDPQSLRRRNADELKSCANKLALRLEDDAPREGKRAVFNVDILDPCWVWEKADLARVTGISVDVGQVPFNFQVGEAVKAIPLHPPQTPEGELEVRLDSCDGALVATLSLTPATRNNAVTSLPKVPLVLSAKSRTAASTTPASAPRTAPASGSIAAGAPAASTGNFHDLCLRFTRRSVDPIWAIDSVQLFE